MKWQFSDGMPIYSQIVSGLTMAIVSGELKAGERLKSVRDMAVDAGVNPNTMQRALGEMERNGLVYSQRTSGRFVTEDKGKIENAKKAIAQEKITNFLDSMTKLGYSRDEIALMLSGEEGGQE